LQAREFAFRSGTCSRGAADSRRRPVAMRETSSCELDWESFFVCRWIGEKTVTQNNVGSLRFESAQTFRRIARDEQRRRRRQPECVAVNHELRSRNRSHRPKKCVLPQTRIDRGIANSRKRPNADGLGLIVSIFRRRGNARNPTAH